MLSPFVGLSEFPCPRGVGAAAFDPSTIPGILAWHAARLESFADGDRVATMVDWSGNGHPAVVLGGAGQNATFKTGIVNGKPVFRFDAIGGYSSFTMGLTLPAPFSMVLVETGDGSGNTRTINSGTVNALMSFGRSGFNQIYNNGPVYSSGSILGPGIGILTIGATSEFYFAGNNVTTDHTRTGDFGVVSYGPSAAVGEQANTDLLEAAFFNHVLTSAQMNYLGAGYSTLFGYPWTPIP